MSFDAQIIESFMGGYAQLLEFVNDKDNITVKDKFQGSIEYDKLVDVEWKQNYLIATKNISHLHEDVYYITLKMLDTDKQFKNIQFKCSYESLTDLVNKLGSALKNIENASNLKHTKF